ncbi:MAG: hypothetical protein PUC65_05845 [Clostridiales bacterium]|nr:hypothetical protein [Clostridiales bacterium]
MKVSKGEHGYIKNRKKAQLLKSILMFGIAAAIYVIGLALNKWQNNNIFTVIAALSVLPAAKMLVSFIVLAPYHTVEDAKYQKLIAATKEEDIVYSDVVFTSEQKVMNLAILVIVGDKAIGLTGRKKENRDYIESYLNNGFNVRCFGLKAKIFEDEESFLHLMKKVERREVSKESRVEWEAYLKSLMV